MNTEAEATALDPTPPTPIARVAAADEEGGRAEGAQLDRIRTMPAPVEYSQQWAVMVCGELFRLAQRIDGLPVANGEPRHFGPGAEVPHPTTAELHAAADKMVAAFNREERDHERTVQERDDAEESLSQAYYLVTGRSPEWSNLFGHKEALEEIGEAVALLKAAAKPTPATGTGGGAERARLAELASKATPGPWKHGAGCCGPFVDYQASEDERGGLEPLSDYNGREPVWLGGTVTEADRAYIAAASPDVVLRLIGDAAAAEARAGEVTEAATMARNALKSHPFPTADAHLWITVQRALDYALRSADMEKAQ